MREAYIPGPTGTGELMGHVDGQDLFLLDFTC